MKLVFLGPPGAGKGTQAVEMARRFDVVHASTGDIFRSAVEGDSELGAVVRKYLDNGKLVPDDLTSRVVGGMVLDGESSFILDGFPRTLGQARSLTRMLEERGLELDAVIYFRLDREEAVKRLTGRRVCGECGRNYHVKFMPSAKEGQCDACGGELISRSDSSREVVEQRLEEYEKKTVPVADYYRERGLLKTIDASLPPDRVTEATQDVIEKVVL